MNWRASDQTWPFLWATERGLDLEDGSADVSILHTVLSHVSGPDQLIAEAARILRPGGTLVICDADFSKAMMGVVPGDPLGSCAEAFVNGSVTDSWLTGKLKPLVSQIGLSITHFSVLNRVVTSGMGGMAWVRMSGARLVSEGVIGKPLADALEAEYLRRAEAGTLYCFLPFVTLIATKPTGWDPFDPMRVSGFCRGTEWENLRQVGL
jgi:arsenite methyltransferase